jgi:hypothetical protein
VVASQTGGDFDEETGDVIAALAATAKDTSHSRPPEGGNRGDAE